MAFFRCYLIITTYHHPISLANTWGYTQDSCSGIVSQWTPLPAQQTRTDGTLAGDVSYDEESLRDVDYDVSLAVDKFFFLFVSCN